MKEILMQAQTSSSVHHDSQCKQQERSHYSSVPKVSGSYTLMLKTI